MLTESTSKHFIFVVLHSEFTVSGGFRQFINLSSKADPFLTLSLEVSLWFRLYEVECNSFKVCVWEHHQPTGSFWLAHDEVWGCSCWFVSSPYSWCVFPVQATGSWAAGAAYRSFAGEVIAALFLRLCGQYLFCCLVPSTRQARSVQVHEVAGCQEAHCTT